MYVTKFSNAPDNVKGANPQTSEVSMGEPMKASIKGLSFSKLIN